MLIKSIGFWFLLLFFNHVLTIDATEFKERDDDYEFIDLGVRLIGAKHDSLIADLIAQERDFINAGHIEGLELYHLHLRRKRNHRSKRSIDDLIESFKHDERIEYLTIGEKLERQKRGFLDNDYIKNIYKQLEQEADEQIKDYDDKHVDISGLQMDFNDKLYSKQWYLENKGQFNNSPYHDANLSPVWLAGYSGKGVTISITDDGIDHSHPELIDRYRPDLSYDLNDLNDNKHDPMPSSFDGKNSHGTHCSGAAVAKANNGLCGVGPAFGAYIAGIRLLDGIVTTLNEARSITMFAPDIDILSASWGPLDDGTRMEAPNALITSALDYAVTKGRHGKGTLVVYASGNGGHEGDHCGADGYVSHQNVISIGAINHLGQTTYFDERCASTIAVTYTGGPHKAFSDEKRLHVAVVTSDVQNKCKTDFYGTSGAAPVAAGIFALVLEANPELTYRDVMHIIARTSRIPSLTETNDWIINGAGYHVSHKFGFGTLDAGQMVAIAQNWTNVQPRYECYHEFKPFTRQLGIGTVTEISIEISDCINVTNLEHVVANISFGFHRRGDVKITLISPSKTPSEMLDYRFKDATSKGIKNFPFLSIRHWDESPIGVWTLRIETREPQDQASKRSAMIFNGQSELYHFGLRLYGSNNDNNKNRMKRNANMAFVPSRNEIETLYKRELSLYQTPHVVQKRDYDLLVKKRNQEKLETSSTQQGFFSFLRRIFTL